MTRRAYQDLTCHVKRKLQPRATMSGWQEGQMTPTQQPVEIVPPRRRRWGKVLFTLFILLLAASAYVCIPRRANLRRFDPAQVAALEAGMWRDYYLHQKL